MNLDRKDLLRKMVRTFELVQVDEKLLVHFHALVKNDSQGEALNLLKRYNKKCEQKKDVKLARPSIHGWEEAEVFTQLVQEAYVTALLFQANDRLLNYMWSGDWELEEQETG